MQALVYPLGICSNSHSPRIRCSEHRDGLIRRPHQHAQQSRVPKQLLQTSAVSGPSQARASATFAETWTSSARRTAFQQELVRPQKPQPVTGQQPSSIDTSSSSPPPSPSPPAVAAHPALKPKAVHQADATSASSPPQPHQQSNSSQTNSQTTQQTLASAVDKMYRQRLREVKAMLTPDSLQQLQQELSPEELKSLQVVMQDLQDLQGSWEDEEDEQLNPAEQRLIEQVTSAAQIMPDDFNSYLMGMLPQGSGQDELQQLLQMLDEPLLRDLKSVYYELKEFEQADLDVSVAQDRYMQLSGRISAVAARIQQTLETQQQQQQSQEWRQSAQGPQHPAVGPATSIRGNSALQQQQQPIRFKHSAAASEQPVQSAASSSSGRKWGSAWAKSQSSHSQGGISSASNLQQVPQHSPGSAQAGQQLGEQQADPREYSTPAATSAPSQQQQQPSVRQRRRRVIRRDATTAD